MRSLILHMLLLDPVGIPAGPVAGTGCHAHIDQRCSALRAEEALRCRNEADAQCDIADAEQFIAAGDVKDAESRVAQACAKYEDQLDMMLPDVEPDALADAAGRYASTSVSIFALLAREGEVEDLTRAVVRLDRSQRYLADLLERRDDLVRHADLAAAVGEVRTRLAIALDQLARSEMHRADQRIRAVGRTGQGDGGALAYFQQAAIHAAQAYALVSRFVYKYTELDAKLAQADLLAVLAREDRSAAPRACAAYRALEQELTSAPSLVPDDQRRQYVPRLQEFAERSARGIRACTAPPRIAAGAALFGVGAAGLSVAAGLYAQYTRACDFAYNESSGQRECLGIPADGGDTDRYTAQVRASIGLAVGAGMVFAAGAALMIPGIVQRERARPRRFFAAPAVDMRQTGVVVQLRF